MLGVITGWGEPNENNRHASCAEFKKTGCHTGGFRNWSYENRSNVKVPHIALLGVSKVFVLIAR